MVWVGCSFLWCTIFFVFLLCHHEVDHRGTYVGRRSALKNPVTSETADVPPFLLVQINFYCTNQFFVYKSIFLVRIYRMANTRCFILYSP